MRQNSDENEDDKKWMGKSLNTSVCYFQAVNATFVCVVKNMSSVITTGSNKMNEQNFHFISWVHSAWYRDNGAGDEKNYSAMEEIKGQHCEFL